MRDKNIFGGGNPNSLYVPLTDVEREVLARLIHSQDLVVHVVGWGVVEKPRIADPGDARIQIQFRLNFDRPEVPMPVYFFDLELRTRSGMLLFRKKYPTVYNGQPVNIAAGMFLDLVWDIAIRNLDPELVKMVKPDATGLTSRLQDRDTKDFTLEGNMRLDPEQKRLLRAVRGGEERMKAVDRARTKTPGDGTG